MLQNAPSFQNLKKPVDNFLNLEFLSMFVKSHMNAGWYYSVTSEFTDISLDTFFSESDTRNLPEFIVDFEAWLLTGRRGG